MKKSDNSVFGSAVKAWNAASAMRRTRRSLMRNTYGEQWSDFVTRSDGSVETEYSATVRKGMRPLTNNLLRSLVKTVVGHFRTMLADERSLLTDEAARLRSANSLEQLDARALEEFLISGCVMQKVSVERRMSGMGVWVDNVSPDRFFVNRYLDPRGNDIRLIGMTADMSLGEVKLRFGHGSRSRCADIGRIYAGLSCNDPFSRGVSVGSDAVSDSFLRPSEPDLCRVIEVWTYDIDSASPFDDPHWHCRFFAPSGELLDETRSYMPDGSHPFVINMYPLTGGGVHPFIEDLVGQQKHINQLITVIDHVLATSAKGVLLLPADCLPDGMDMETAVEMWSRPGGVIPINPNASRMPVEMSSAGGNAGAAQLLENELKMFQRISGVTSAFQGQAEGNLSSASLFKSQVDRTLVSLLDVFETFNAFRRSRDEKMLTAFNIFLH